MAERPELLGLATEIVSAHVSNNPIASDQIPGLIQQVFNALATVEQASAAPPKAEPAVTVKKSVSGRSHRLPRLRQAFLHAEAAPDDRSQADARSSTGSDGSYHGRTLWSHPTMQRRDRHWRRRSDWVARVRHR